MPTMLVLPNKILIAQNGLIRGGHFSDTLNLKFPIEQAIDNSYQPKMPLIFARRPA